MYDVFFFKQKTAYELRISDWSSDVCSSDLREEECERRLRDTKPRRHRNVRDCPGDHRKLPDPDLRAQRQSARTANTGDLTPLRPQRPPERDTEPGTANARLLLPVGARHPAARAGPGRGRARLYPQPSQTVPPH